MDYEIKIRGDINDNKINLHTKKTGNNKIVFFAYLHFLTIFFRNIGAQNCQNQENDSVRTYATR